MKSKSKHAEANYETQCRATGNVNPTVPSPNEQENRILSLLGKYSEGLAVIPEAGLQEVFERENEYVKLSINFFNI